MVEKTLHINSYSEFGQDLWVSEMTQHKQGGYFIEIGARDGIKTSNTLALEQDYNWKGLLVEPDKRNYSSLKRNRKNQLTDPRAVYSNSGEVTFYTGKSSGLGSLKPHENISKESYTVASVTLDDLLAQHNCPKNIDYMSLDVEGVEYEILQAFSFKYRISFITVECGNYGSDRKSPIRDLMFSNGYKLYPMNGTDIEDWFYL